MQGHTQDGKVVVESSDKIWSTEKGVANHFSILVSRNPTLWKGKKKKTQEDEAPGSVDVQYATGEQPRNNSRKNDEAGPRQKWNSVLDVSVGKNWSLML